MQSMGLGMGARFIPRMPRVPMGRVRMPSLPKVPRAELPRDGRGWFSIGFRNAGTFFDTAAVTTMLDHTTWQVYNRFGAVVRVTAKRSMRKKAGPSTPGRPPHAHGNPLIKRRMRYGFDMVVHSVVIGPGLNNARSGGQLDKLEDGGFITVTEMVWRRSKPTDGGMRRNYRRRETRRIYTLPRPFMGPAFKKTLPNLPSYWAQYSK